MKTSDDLPYFDGSVSELAKALRITVQAVYAWNGDVPKLRQYEIRDLISVKQLPVVRSAEPRSAAEGAA
jgi:hypothetical protein